MVKDLICSGGPMDGEPVDAARLCDGEFVHGIAFSQRDTKVGQMFMREPVWHWASKSYHRQVRYKLDFNERLVFAGYL